MYWVTCVERGEVDKMLRFIRLGIDVNERLPNGDTPLHVCVRCGHISAAQDGCGGGGGGAPSRASGR